MTTWSDACTRANHATDPGGSWVVAAGALGVTSNAVACKSPDGTDSLAYNTQDLADIHQSLVIDVPTWHNDGRVFMAFRMSTGAAPFYMLKIAKTFALFNRYATAFSGEDEIQEHTVSFAEGARLAATCKLTGTGVEIRLWEGVTADIADVGGETWDSAGPDFLFTTNPPTPDDSGVRVGAGGSNSSAADQVRIDNIFAGDIPVASGALPGQLATNQLVRSRLVGSSLLQ